MTLGGGSYMKEKFMIGISPISIIDVRGYMKNEIEELREMTKPKTKTPKKMTKPKPRKEEVLYLQDCEKYVAHKLGLHDLRDTLGKFAKPLKKNWEEIEYRDFWHFLCDKQEVHNGCDIWMLDEGDEPWQTEIVNCFLDEFGDGPYRVNW